MNGNTRGKLVLGVIVIIAVALSVSLGSTSIAVPSARAVGFITITPSSATSTIEVSVGPFPSGIIPNDNCPLGKQGWIPDVIDWAKWTIVSTSLSGSPAYTLVIPGQSSSCGSGEGGASPNKYVSDFNVDVSSLPSGQYTIKVGFGNESGGNETFSDTFTVLPSCNPKAVGSFSIQSVTPNTATNEVIASGTASGGEWFKACPSSYTLVGYHVPLEAAQYSIDGTPGEFFGMTETETGASGQCSQKGSTSGTPYLYSFNFPASNDLSSLSPGTHTLLLSAWSFNFLGSSTLACATTTFSVSPPSIATGTITVSSVNSAIPSTLVPTSWDFGVGGPSVVDPCGVANSNLCANMSMGQYVGTVGDTYSLDPIPGDTPSGYVLQSVSRDTVAQTKSPFVSFIKDFIHEARAYEVCGYADSGDQGCSWNSASPQIYMATSTASPNNATENFTINWAPLGVIMATTPGVLNSGNGMSQQMTLANGLDGGGTPGSVVDNLSVVQPIVYGQGQGASNWLNSPDLSGIILAYNATPITVQLSANQAASACSTTCTATITFEGWTADGSRQVESIPITVTLQGGGGGNGYVVKVTPPSSTLALSGSQQFVASTTDPAGVRWQFGDSTCIPVTAMTACGQLSSQYSSSSVPIFYTASSSLPNSNPVSLVAMSITDPSASDAAAITISPPPPTLTLTPLTQTINLPNSATLHWVTKYASTCSASNSASESDWGWVNSPNVNGSQSVTPAAAGTVQYTLTCSGSGGTVSRSVTVTAFNAVCHIHADPQSIVVPNTTNLIYSCSSVPSSYICSITDSFGNSGYDVSRPNANEASGTDVISPAVTTRYTIICQDPSSPAAQATDDTTVIVTNPGVGECNPQTNPQGCPPTQ